MIIFCGVRGERRQTRENESLHARTISIETYASRERTVTVAAVDANVVDIAVYRLSMRGHGLVAAPAAPS